MSAPLLQPTPEPPRRAGADDHYRYTSPAVRRIKEEIARKKGHQP